MGLDIEDALKAAGSWNRYQKIILLMSFAAAIPNAFTSLHFVFSQFEPQHHCKYPEKYLAFNNQTNPEIISTIIPNELNKENEWVPSKCKIYDRNYSQYPVEAWPEQFKDTNDSAITECSNGVTFSVSEEQATVTTEFSMVCDGDWMAPLAVSMYSMGMVVSCLCGAAADRYGRRPVFLLATLIQILAQVLCAISWNFPVYCVSILVSGTCGSINYSVFFVLGTEVTDHKWRNFMGTSSIFGYSAGYCAIPLLAYLIPHWRYFIGAMTVIGAVIYVPCCWWFPESPRWLAQRGRSDDAIYYLRRIARVNNREKLFEEALEASKGNCIISKENVTTSKIRETVRVLFRTGIGGRFCTAVYGWFITSTVYYALSLYSSDFSTDRFVNFFLGGLCEFPACFVGFLLLKYIGRPRTTLLLMSITGVSSIILPYIPKDYQSLSTTFAMLGKGATSAVFYAWYLLSTEIVPTLQRSFALSICSAFARIGSFCAPYIMYCRKYNYWIPNVIMGGASVFSGVVTIFLIPETLGLSLPDTGVESRENRRFYRLNIFKKFPKTKEDCEKKMSANGENEMSTLM